MAEDCILGLGFDAQAQAIHHVARLSEAVQSQAFGVYLSEAIGTSSPGKPLASSCLGKKPCWKHRRAFVEGPTRTCTTRSRIPQAQWSIPIQSMACGYNANLGMTPSHSAKLKGQRALIDTGAASNIGPITVVDKFYEGVRALRNDNMAAGSEPERYQYFWPSEGDAPTTPFRMRSFTLGDQKHGMHPSDLIGRWGTAYALSLPSP